MLAFSTFKFLPSFEQTTSHFHFVLGPTYYVANPAYVAWRGLIGEAGCSSVQPVSYSAVCTPSFLPADKGWGWAAPVLQQYKSHE